MKKKYANFLNFIQYKFGQFQNIEQLNQNFRESLLQYASQTPDNLECVKYLRIDFDEKQSLDFFLGKIKVQKIYEYLVENQWFSDQIDWRTILLNLHISQKTKKDISVNLNHLVESAWEIEDIAKPSFLQISKQEWEAFCRFNTLRLQVLSEN